MASDGSFELTGNQRKVLSCLRAADAPLGAYAILQRVRPDGIIHPPSVYRVLKELVRLGLAHRINSLGSFVACKDAVMDSALTRNQREVLCCLRAADVPLGAYAILERVRAVGIIYPATVYRALNDLIQLGFVHRIESLGSFVAAKGTPRAHRSAFLICSGCQKVVEVALRIDQQDVLESLLHEEFKIERLVALEFVGRCRACRSVSAEACSEPSAA